MPDDDTNANHNSFDREPSTGSFTTPETTSNPDTVEHADLKHRLEADSTDGHDSAAQTAADRPTEPVAPAAVVSPSVATADETELPHPGPGLMVLQWLVYALWGWTVLMLSGLVGLVINNLLSSKEETGGTEWYGGGIAYLLAAVIVLYVIALICDVFYNRFSQKYARTTGTNVIMVIHAVIFALFGVGALIWSVFSGVSMLIGDSSDTTGAITGILTGGVIFVIYGLTLLRTLQPRGIKRVAPWYWVAITVITVAAIAAGVVGPAAQAKLRAQDQLIERELPDVAQAVNDYAESNGRLPATLNDITYRSYDRDTDTKRVLELIEYKPGEQLTASKISPVNGGVSLDDLRRNDSPVFHYQLCVEYKSSTGDSRDYDSYRSGANRYPTTVSTYQHDAGVECYDVQTDYQY